VDISQTQEKDKSGQNLHSIVKLKAKAVQGKAVTLAVPTNILEHVVRDLKLGLETYQKHGESTKEASSTATLKPSTNKIKTTSVKKPAPAPAAASPKTPKFRVTSNCAPPAGTRRGSTGNALPKIAMQSATTTKEHALLLKSTGDSSKPATLTKKPVGEHRGASTPEKFKQRTSVLKKTTTVGEKVAVFEKAMASPATTTKDPLLKEAIQPLHNGTKKSSFNSSKRIIKSAKNAAVSGSAQHIQNSMVSCKDKVPSNSAHKCPPNHFVRAPPTHRSLSDKEEPEPEVVARATKIKDQHDREATSTTTTVKDRDSKSFPNHNFLSSSGRRNAEFNDNQKNVVITSPNQASKIKDKIGNSFNSPQGMIDLSGTRPPFNNYNTLSDDKPEDDESSGSEYSDMDSDDSSQFSSSFDSTDSEKVPRRRLSRQKVTAVAAPVAPYQTGLAGTKLWDPNAPQNKFRIMALKHAATCQVAAAKGGGCPCDPICGQYRAILHHVETCRKSDDCPVERCQSTKTFLLTMSMMEGTPEQELENYSEKKDFLVSVGAVAPLAYVHVKHKVGARNGDNLSSQSDHSTLMSSTHSSDWMSNHGSRHDRMSFLGCHESSAMKKH